MAIPVVLIDDDENYLAVIQLVLEANGFRVSTATNGTSAKEVISREDPEVVLIDWNIPGQDGLSILKAIRADDRHRNKYLILVTARNDLQAKLQGMEAGADDYLTKPFDNQELLARIRVGVRTRELQRALSDHARRGAIYEMAVSIAHEIGNPLTTAKLLIQRLRRYPEVQRLLNVQTDLDTLNQELVRIENLVRKAQSLRDVKSIPYYDGISMIDLRSSSEPKK
jgi:DNA-binding response OmpR family regulator